MSEFEFKLYLDNCFIKSYKYYRCLIKYVYKLKDIAYRREGIDLIFKVIDSNGVIFLFNPLI